LAKNVPISENKGVAATLKTFRSQMRTIATAVTKIPSFMEFLTKEALSKSLNVPFAP